MLRSLALSLALPALGGCGVTGSTASDRLRVVVAENGSFPHLAANQGVVVDRRLGANGDETWRSSLDGAERSAPNTVVTRSRKTHDRNVVCVASGRRDAKPDLTVWFAIESKEGIASVTRIGVRYSGPPGRSEAWATGVSGTLHVDEARLRRDGVLSGSVDLAAVFDGEATGIPNTTTRATIHAGFDVDFNTLSDLSIVCTASDFLNASEPVD